MEKNDDVILYKNKYRKKVIGWKKEMEKMRMKNEIDL